MLLPGRGHRIGDHAREDRRLQLARFAAPESPTTGPSASPTARSAGTPRWRPGSESVTQGAGLFNSGGTVSIVNSTFSGNSQIATSGAISSGSAIENLGTELTLLNVTVAGNSGAPAIAQLRHAQHQELDLLRCSGGNCDGALTSQGTNLESTDQCGLHAAGDQVGKDPLLGALADNGGQTDTLALLPQSPAIDRGSACPPTDQRGVARPQRPACDVGAYELVAWYRHRSLERVHISGG